MERATANKYSVLGEERQRDELARWFDGYEWQYFVTFTYRFPSDGERAFKSWARKVEKLTGRPVNFAVFTERSTSGMVHHHALVAGVEALSVTALRGAWSHGHSDAQRYDPGKGAAHYVSKGYGSTRLVSWDVSERLPPEASELTEAHAAHPRS